MWLGKTNYRLHLWRCLKTKMVSSQVLMRTNIRAKIEVRILYEGILESGLIKGAEPKIRKPAIFTVDQLQNHRLRNAVPQLGST